MTQQIIVTLLIVLLAWFLVRLTTRAGRVLKANMAQREPSLLNEQIINFGERFISILIIAAALLLILPIFGLNINGLLAIGGIGGILIGFAMKDVLTNVLGAFIVYIDNLFVVGDVIILSEKKIQGTVVAIRWRQTVVRTVDKREIYIPNAFFINDILENLSRKKHFHLQETLPLAPLEPEKFKCMVEDIRTYLQQCGDIDPQQKIAVYLTSVAQGSFDLMINVYLKANDERLKQEILLNALKIAVNYGGRLMAH